MKIGVVADTHSHPLPKEMLERFKEVDFIIHAGDFCAVETLEELKKIKEVKAVYGNMDDEAIRKIFPRKQIVAVKGLALGIFHGEGPAQAVLQRVRKEFQHEKVDIVIFGHSHNPFSEKIENVLYFNPGSPNDPIYAPYCSFGIVEINDEGTNSRIVKIGRS